MPSSALIDIKNLSVSFKTDEGAVKAVDDVSIRINRREVFGIVGESGSGKSVTALSILRLLPYTSGIVTSGAIWFHPENGEPFNLMKLPDTAMRKIRGNSISMIFQEPMTSLNPVYRCGKQVVESLRLHHNVDKKEAKQKALDLLTRLQLPRPELIYRAYPHELSGGQKQRVMIAMAMICHPGVLIADEPTTALDVTVQKSILSMVLGLKKDFNTSIIFITHDLGVISQIADRVAVMYQGKVVETGSALEVLTHPRHPYTRGLLACRPAMNKEYARLPTIQDFMNPKIQLPTNFEAGFYKTLSQQDKAHEKIIHETNILGVSDLKTWFWQKRGLFKKKEKIKAVDGVSFEVFPGETLGLVGESGCGKTTLGRTLLQLIPAHGGRVLFQGVDLSTLGRKQMKIMRKDLQIIFQDPYSSLNPRLTVGAAITEPMMVFRMCRNHEERKEKSIGLLEKVGLPGEYFFRYPHELSGGQRQRICIARALAAQPKFIVCDESVSALDVSIQAQILNLLNDLKKTFQLTFIFISHDLSVVKFMSDRIAVMKEGKIIELDQAGQIYKNPETAYTQKLIDSIPT